MAFKTVEQYNDDRYRNLFRIVQDKETADVIFLYRSRADMLEADSHYIKSSDYSGYVHCCGEGCPACGKGIRLQTKVFIPVYNIKKDAIEFWDRTMKFEPQFKRDVFDKFPNPSEYVFRITRHGLPNDTATTYSIEAVGKNSYMSYEQILAKFNATMPDYYENIIKPVSISELNELLQNSGNDSVVINQDYVPTPRAGYQSSIPDTYVNVSEVVSDNAPTAVPEEYTPESEEGETELPDPIF